MEMNKDSSEGVAAEVSGVGLPYAPENWPQDGDIWRWKTGRRVVPKGTHFQDRYLYLPERLKKEKEEKEIQASASKKSSHIFATKAALRKYIHTYFPETDFESFLKTFSWRIPALLDFGLPVPIAAQPIREACGSSLLHGSENPAAKELLHYRDNGNVMDLDGHSEDKAILRLESYDFPPPPSIPDDEVDQVLRELRKSQEHEYEVVQNTLQTQKTYLQQLYQRLQYEENGQSSAAASSHAVRETKKEIRRELKKFENMKKIAHGFGKTPNCIKKNHFRL